MAVINLLTIYLVQFLAKFGGDRGYRLIFSHTPEMKMWSYFVKMKTCFVNSKKVPMRLSWNFTTWYSTKFAVVWYQSQVSSLKYIWFFFRFYNQISQKKMKTFGGKYEFWAWYIKKTRKIHWSRWCCSFFEISKNKKVKCIYMYLGEIGKTQGRGQIDPPL